MRCKHCLKGFEVNLHTPAQFVFCPECGKLTYDMSEYGFGTVYPIGYYLGYRMVGQVVQKGEYPNYSYVLERINEPDIELEEKNYPDVSRKALDIIDQWLNG